MRLAVVLLGQSHLGRDAVVEMTSLLLPEIFEILALELGEIELLITDGLILQRSQFFDLLLGRPESRYGQVPLVLVSSRVRDLDLIEVCLDKLFDIFPLHLVGLIILPILISSLKMQNESVFHVEILGDKKNSALLVSRDDLCLLLVEHFLAE